MDADALMGRRGRYIVAQFVTLRISASARLLRSVSWRDSPSSPCSRASRSKSAQALTLARRNERWAQLAVLAYLATVLGIAFFYYPTVFGAEQQTVFGWFENDVYVGLLVTATYLGVLRLRRTTLTPV